MTNTLEMRKSNLVLPTSGYQLDREEMSYVEGGAKNFWTSTAFIAGAIDVATLVFCGVVNAAMRAAGFFGKGAAKTFILKSAPSWAKPLRNFTTTIAAITGGGDIIKTAIGMFDDLSPYVERIIGLLSIGGLIAGILDMCDGSWDGYIDF